MDRPNSYFSLSDLDNIFTKVHYFDFGYFKSGYNSSYYDALDTLNTNFQNNPYFLSMIGLESDLMGNNCIELLFDNFSDHSNVGLFVNDDFNNAFDNNVESVVFNENAEILI